MREPLRLFFVAAAFLTRLPCPKWAGQEPADLARSTTYFPLVGLLVGSLGGLVYAGAALAWPPSVAGALATIATVWLTGAFHEDALADSLDAFGGGWNRAQVLAIMKDSRIGAYGAVGLVLAIATKLAAIAALAANGTGAVVRALVAAHVLGRWSSLPLIRRYPYARPDEAEARSKPFASSVTNWRLAAGTVLAVLLATAALGRQAPVPLAVALAVTLGAGRYFHRRLGGITGDCLGAANQAVELSVYLVLAFHPRGG